MIELIFNFGIDVILVVIKGRSIFFGNTSYGTNLSDINGLKLSHSGVIREFPDLKGHKDWRSKAISRFKSKIKSMKTEEEISDYIIEDLKKFGYVPKFKKKQGFRREKIE